VRLEKEAGDDAKIAATAAQSPKEISTFCLASDYESAVRQHHIGFEQIVAG